MTDKTPLLNKIHLGDCLDFMKQLPDKCIDLVLTDPPYGIGIDGQKESICKNPKHSRKEHLQKEWDNERPSKEFFDEMIRISKNQIIWGGNYFADLLPASRQWFVWDKGQKGLTMSDGELAYSSFDKPLRIKELNRVALLKDGTIHPTQKPQELIEWCLVQSGTKGIVLDCFSGSGTTAVACHKLGIPFICIEKDPDYHAASLKRLEQEMKNQYMF